MSNFDAKAMATDMIALCKNMIKSPFQTINAEIAKGRSWKTTMTAQVLPLLVLVAIIAFILNIVSGNPISIVATILEPIFGAAGLLLFAFIMGKIAPMLGGKDDLDKAFSVTFLTMIPMIIISLIFNVLTFLALLSFVLLGYTIYLLYKAAGEQLDVTKLPQRIVLVMAPMVICIVIMMIISPAIPHQPMPEDFAGMEHMNIPK